MKPALSLVAILLLAACVEEPLPGPVPEPGGIIPQSTCGADLVQAYVGLPLALLPAEPAGVIRRVIRPGDAVTEDFSLQRQNVYVDASGLIVRLTCG
ncbi:MAG: hypothetical protein C0524_18210 [Rhodobacter sp.]|nr:hypothetical protein [Rhodobacter sp.]